ncbi:hypothetical protein EY643_17350 [Halioglobus maricola]|uniref:Glycosyltransferase RgtA/B/C/D-like domain-containing protein n=1 Tax=Halioglobus maricola TaxID=2601894 RepID=A0A5P9NN93_9GAMM|nr:hypothetical protein [Halioglobus maricola]QFU77281.1 hypothetical protein EY643_17350 [Halioglobus maricola]
MAAFMRFFLPLALLFMLALVPRLYSAQTLGWGWDNPDSFTLINYDEGGSCRSALQGFSYSPFIGYQTIALASVVGAGPPASTLDDAAIAKRYCHSSIHVLVARSYSALLGAGTVVVLALLALQLVPAQPAVAFTSAALLALSGFHLSHSQSGTVDAASTFFIYSFLAALAWAVRRRYSEGFLLALALCIAAVWTKYWVFAVFAWLALVPEPWWRYISRGFSRGRIAALVVAASVLVAAMVNIAWPQWGLVPLALVYFAIVPWRAVARPMALCWLLLPALCWLFLQVDLINAYTQGGGGGRFGSGYNAIGENKWLRNLFNIPMLLLVALGLPALLFVPKGVSKLLSLTEGQRLWVCMLPVLVFLLFMAFLAPVTYYRHYLPLLPAVALLAALGLHNTAWGQRRWFLALFFVWPAMLAWDMVSDYHNDPRKALRPWYQEHVGAQVFTSYYVNPPPGRNALFRPEFAEGDGAVLRRADYLILSENWYDTAFANELNGPLVSRQENLIKTTPEYTAFYRSAVANEHPLLELEREIDLHHFMPEMLLHRALYGNVQLFVGDLKLFRIRE